MKQVIIRIRKNNKTFTGYTWYLSQCCPEIEEYNNEDRLVLIDEDIRNLKEEIHKLSGVVSTLNRMKNELKEIETYRALLLDEMNLGERGQPND